MRRLMIKLNVRLYNIFKGEIVATTSKLEKGSIHIFLGRYSLDWINLDPVFFGTGGTQKEIQNYQVKHMFLGLGMVVSRCVWHIHHMFGRFGSKLVPFAGQFGYVEMIKTT
ncbi:hypothetical protein ACJX0J_020788, partial [Zea mays]